jgi:exopolysaccharide biosynthesis polyprenyl glycosylphosphotransferase
LLAFALAERARATLQIGAAIPEDALDVQPVVALIAVALWLVTASRLGLYRLDRSIHALEQCGHALSISLIVGALLAGVLYMTFRDVSRLLFVYFFLFSAVGFVAVRLILIAVVRWAIPNEQRIAIIGTGPLARTVAHSLRRTRWGDLPRSRFVGFISAGEEDGEERGPWREPEPLLGVAEEAEALTRRALERDIHEILLALPPEKSERVNEIVGSLRQAGLGVRMIPDVIELAATQARVENFGGIPVIYLRDPSVQAVEQAAKRALDVALSAVLLVLLGPILAAVALMVRVDSPGPILYRAARVGQRGRLFTMYKFRTMVHNAPPPTSTTGEAGTSVVDSVFKAPQDPRVTRIGRFLRRTSLDELPQLVNVLRGDMSLVGPRPEQPFIVEAYRPWQRRRLEVRPGMTGWWQVKGRSLPMHWHTEYDLYYIYNYSLGLDAKILARTLWAVIHGRGAY